MPYTTGDWSIDGINIVNHQGKIIASNITNPEDLKILSSSKELLNYLKELLGEFYYYADNNYESESPATKVLITKIQNLVNNLS